MQEENVETKSQKITKAHLLKKIPKGSGKSTLYLALGAFVVVVLGVGTGWLLSGSGSLKSKDTAVVPGSSVSENEAGVEDGDVFPDTAEGVLEEGGIEGEGTHHLVREGGPSKYVYLTSTVIDLQSFVGKKVTVWGETLSGQSAGWLMDVGKVKVID